MFRMYLVQRSVKLLDCSSQRVALADCLFSVISGLS